MSGGQVQVESKSGNTYPARVEYDHMVDEIYSQVMNDAHDHLTFWAWVNFDRDDTAVIEDWTRNNGDYPGAPPWDN